MSALHTIFVTHTHERIARSLMSMRPQSRTPKTITVASDNDSPLIADEVRRAADALDREITLVQRPANPVACRAQNRNNAVRALIRTHNPAGSDTLVFYDGDCIACPQANETHAESLTNRELSLGSAALLTKQQTASLSDEHAATGQTDTLLNPSQREQLAKNHRRTRRHIVYKHLGVTKPHKPKLLAGNFAMRLSIFRMINGFDESFVEWGMEDDDLARRAYMLGARPICVMDRAVVYHQYHPTHAPKRWKSSSNAIRLSAPAIARCRLGLDNPAPQHPLRSSQIVPSVQLVGDPVAGVLHAKQSEISIPA